MATREQTQTERAAGAMNQNLWLHFGFGSATIIDSMLIRWPSGKVDPLPLQLLRG